MCMSLIYFYNVEYVGIKRYCLTERVCVCVCVCVRERKRLCICVREEKAYMMVSRRNSNMPHLITCDLIIFHLILFSSLLASDRELLAALWGQTWPRRLGMPGREKIRINC